MLASENPIGKLQTGEILNRLEAQYHAFAIGAGEQGENKTGLAGLFDRWFHSMAPTEPEPLYADFLSVVQTLVNQLADALREGDAEERDEPIQIAAKIVLVAKPINKKSQAEWYMIAAEHSFSALIPLLKLETLQSIRDDYLKSYPKRTMYPRQLALLKQMEQKLR